MQSRPLEPQPDRTPDLSDAAPMRQGTAGNAARTWSGALGLGLALTALSVTIAFALTHRTSPPLGLLLPEHPRQLVDFSLTDRTGRTVKRADLNGKLLVVNFVFTSCSVTCPVVNGCMARIQKLTAGQPDVRLVSLTVDPRDDTPEVLAEYGQRFGADTNRWLLLTGERNQLYNLIATSFLHQDLDDPFSNMPGGFLHIERVAVVDSSGVLRGYFDGMQANTDRAVVDELAWLRRGNR